MTDIVERLRRASVYEEYKAILSNLGDEAADEIERLRAATKSGSEASAAGRVDDAEVMRLWRKCGLPEYFLGNGGSNHKLVAFAKACATDEIERLRAQVVSLQSSLEVGKHQGKKTP